jgi:prepilin signal peptidase PulO-like enzyme (type II secretory pathway)
MTKNTYNLLTIVVLIMAIIQTPFIYYYTFGLFALFIIPPYLLIGSSLTIWLSIVTLRNKKTYITLPYKIIVFITIFIGSSSFFWGEETIESLKTNKLKLILKYFNGNFYHALLFQNC